MRKRINIKVGVITSLMLNSKKLIESVLFRIRTSCQLILWTKLMGKLVYYSPKSISKLTQPKT